MSRAVLVLLCILGGAVAGGAIGFVVLAGERCAGPACAGLIVIPMMGAGVGAVAGIVVGLVWALSKQPAPKV